jgi:hypothetical protein
MKCAAALYLALGLLAAPVARAGEADPHKPYGRACIAVVDRAGDEHDIGSYQPAAGETEWTVVVHVEVNHPCIVVVAAFDTDQSGHLATWTPEVAELKDWEDAALPKPPVAARIKAISAGEFYVLFLPVQSGAAADIKRLAAVMKKPGIDAPTAKLQADKLRTLISGAVADADHRHLRAGPAHPEIGGVFRGGGPDWRKFASEVNFSDESPSLLIFPLGKRK